MGAFILRKTGDCISVSAHNLSYMVSMFLFQLWRQSTKVSLWSLDNNLLDDNWYGIFLHFDWDDGGCSFLARRDRKQDIVWQKSKFPFRLLSEVLITES